MEVLNWSVCWKKKCLSVLSESPEYELLSSRSAAILIVFLGSPPEGACLADIEKREIPSKDH